MFKSAQDLSRLVSNAGAAAHSVQYTADEIRFAVRRIDESTRVFLAVCTGAVLGLSLITAVLLGRTVKLINEEIDHA